MWCTNVFKKFIIIYVHVHASDCRVDPLASPTPGAADQSHLLSSAPTRSVMVQTDYRESETQTDPYSPDYVVRPGSQPEILTITSLTYGKE